MGTAHAKLAPSAAHRWIRCPGSVALCEGLPDPETSYAAEGTFAHFAAATCLAQGATAAQAIGLTDGRFTVDDDMAEALQLYIDAVLCANLTGDVCKVEIEAKVKLPGVHPHVWGTADALIWSNNFTRLDVFDLKYGAGIYVEVNDNPQLMIYGVGALQSFPADSVDVEVVCIHVVQPRHFGGGRKWRHQDFTREELVTFGYTLRDAATATEQPDAELCAGGWCQFCPAKPTCPKLQDTALEAARLSFSDLEAPAKLPPDPVTLEGFELQRILDAAPMLESWLSAIRGHAQGLAQRGLTVPGYKLVRKTAHRAWRDEDAAEAALVAAKVHPWPPHKVISPAQAEKALGKARRGIVAELVHTPSTGTVLVAESDRRAAVVLADVFTDVKELE